MVFSALRGDGSVILACSVCHDVVVAQSKKPCRFADRIAKVDDLARIKEKRPPSSAEFAITLANPPCCFA